VKRIVMVLTVALVVAVMAVAMAAPAFADKVGNVGTETTGSESCVYHQIFNNGINPQFSCAKNP
jgi:hypothetical protein